MNLIEELVNRIDQAGLWQKSITLNRHEYLVVSGSTDTRLYFIESGSVRVFMPDEEEEQTIRFGYRNSFILALDSFLTGRPTDTSIQAIRKTQLKMVPKEVFLPFMMQDVDHMRLWQQLLEMLVLQCLEREKDILTVSPKERYRRVFERSPQLFQEVPARYIASYLRMTPETLSRIRKSGKGM
jgi:CRP-like cAMP-binding protein